MGMEMEMEMEKGKPLFDQDAMFQVVWAGNRRRSSSLGTENTKVGRDWCPCFCPYNNILYLYPYICMYVAMGSWGALGFLDGPAIMQRADNVIAELESASGHGRFKVSRPKFDDANTWLLNEHPI